MPNHDWHVMYTRYLQRILVDKAVCGYTDEEAEHAELVEKWMYPELAKCWAVEKSLQGAA